MGSVSLSGQGATFNLSTSDGDKTSNGMLKVITFTSADQACTITITPNNAQKLYFVYNNAGHALTFKQGSSGSTVAIPNGNAKVIFADGGGTSAVGTVTFAISSSVTVSGVNSTSGLGSVTPFAGADVPVTGFDLVSGLGSVTFVVSVDVTLGSVGATGRIGKLISWNNIVPDPVTNWSTVTPSPNTSWSEVA